MAKPTQHPAPEAQAAGAHTVSTPPAWHGFVIAAVCGLLFGWGLALSDMVNPLTVQAFLDIAGPWDPSLAWVMGGAVWVSLLGFQLLILRRQAPICGSTFHLPQAKAIDARLVAGAALFGVGWGLSGYCPGPALTTLLAGNPEAWVFVPAMFAGAWLQRQTNRH